MPRKFTRYPSNYVQCATTSAITGDEIKNYIKEICDTQYSNGDFQGVVFNLSGRFPDLTLEQFSDIVDELYQEGYEIPGMEY